MITQIRPRIESKTSSIKPGVNEYKTTVSVYVDKKKVAYESFSFHKHENQFKFTCLLEELLNKYFVEGKSTLDIRYGVIIIYQPNAEPLEDGTVPKKIIEKTLKLLKKPSIVVGEDQDAEKEDHDIEKKDEKSEVKKPAKKAGNNTNKTKKNKDEELFNPVMS